MERQSARGIVKKDDTIILIHRIKNDQEYWVVPGGGIEIGETSQEALRREMKEELGIQVRIIKEVARIRKDINGIGTTEIFYGCEYLSGDIGSGQGEEFAIRNTSQNFYKVEALNAEAIQKTTIMPTEIKNVILDILDGSYVTKDLLTIDSTCEK